MKRLVSFGRSFYKLTGIVFSACLLTIVASGLADTQTGLVGLWDFDDPAYLTKAAIGNDLSLVGSHSATVGIDASDGAVSIGVGSHYIADHDIAPAVGEGYVNEWSLLVDFKYPTLGWISFFQTNSSNGNDGDCFVRGGGGIPGSLGVSATGYTSMPTATETWYRMVVTVDNGSFYRIYVNGDLWLDGSVQSIDGRFSLDPVLLLFADENGEDNQIDVSTVAIYDRPLTASDVADLKGPLGMDVDQQPTVLTKPFLQSVKEDGITVMWELSGQADCSVDYGLDTSYGNSAVCSNETSGAGSYIYKAEIGGLEADTTYHFRVTAGEETLEDQTFTTAPIGFANFSFGVWSDSQGSSSATIPMMQHMAASGVDFGVACGDMAENGGNYGSVKAYFLDRVVKYLGSVVPFTVAWGNHDNYGNAMIKKYTDAGPGNYSFDYAGCHFICIDDAYRSNYSWIENDLQAAVADNARYIFVFVHRPPYCERWIDGDSAFRTYLVPLFEQYGVDACFSGHTHEYERGFSNGVYYCITGGGSWLDHGEPVVYDWSHMTVGGAHDLASGINGGLVNEYVRIDVDEYGFTASIVPFYSDGTYRPGIDETFSKTDPLADINDDGSVDLSDMARLAENWLAPCTDCAGADVNGDDSVDMDDLAIIAGSWMWQQ
ncbi:putative exopolysaccharide biosynthesis protein [Anaerohalosphaera lusitana]|uniref:Putative exopolysaccharide biosynthesis protein n=1 Tax=Anaerohalosphaera lusitana TaxID=1936003 RepID=A0A1U9NJH1_9BACT|nr:metallophosphoesterase [Anaerohalosphaera lusitana]AQT67888.1 putative exopolysaccharide biosynthesis protein [Anaerohalosphaera lusitana]